MTEANIWKHCKRAAGQVYALHVSRPTRPPTLSG